MKAFRVRSNFTIRDTDPLVREHRVHDIHILPGVSMLDTAYKTLAAAHCKADSVVLRDILFHEPVVTHAGMDRYLTVTVEMNGENGLVSITSVPSKNEQPLSDDTTLHMTCNVQRIDSFGLAPLPADVDSQMGTAFDLDTCYGVTRHIGIFHDSFMKCLGTVAPLQDGSFVGTVALGERASARMNDFILHPVFLDCSTIVPLFNLRDRLDEAKLFIPFAIEEFRARSLTGQQQLRVLVEKTDVGNADQEILRYSAVLYDMNGDPLARIRNFGVKRVRSLDAIHRLLALGTSARTMTMPAAAIQLPAEQKHELQSDTVLDLIGALIVQYGDVDWNPDDAEKPFFDLGLDSLALLEISEKLEKKLDIRLYPTLLFECPSAAQLATYLYQTFPEQVATLGAKKRNALPLQQEERIVPIVQESLADHHPQAPQILVPRWMPVRFQRSDEGAKNKTVAVLGTRSQSAFMDYLAEQLGDRLCYQSHAENGAEVISDFQRVLEEGMLCDAVWLAGSDHHLAFSLVKALLHAGHLQLPLMLKAFTFNAFGIHDEAPDAQAGHGIWGLWQSVSREYPKVNVTLVDLDHGELQQALSEKDAVWLPQLLQDGASSRELRALRAGRLYERQLFGVHPSQHTESLLRQGGTYLIIGGAGGVGMEFVRHLRHRYAAHVAIIGRSALTAERQALLSAEGKYGTDILYLQACVEDEAALTQAIQQVRTQFGALHGIVHSAMVLSDQRLADMDAESFSKVLQPKVEGTQALARATENCELDFLLFFSSMQSFVGNVSQANYAAASTFLDGFAASLRADRSYPVVVVNWGFWSEAGAVATNVYRHLLARQGLFGLRSAAALDSLEHMLSAGWSQALIVAAEEWVLQEIGLNRNLVLQRHASRVDLTPVPVQMEAQHVHARRKLFADTQQAMQALLQVARRHVVQILRDLGVAGPAAGTVEQTVSAGKITREHASLVQALLRYMQKVHALEAEGIDTHTFSAAVSQMAETNALLRHFVPLLRTSLAAYPDILGGRRSAAEVLFPGGSPELVRAVYGQSEISLFYNQAVAHAIRALALNQTSRPVRILEIGAGTGATSMEVLRVLDEAGISCEYRYTDLWDKLVVEARERLGSRYPNMRFSFLDIGTEPSRQGLHEAFDIVVATNVLHATRDLRLSLRHVKRLLRPGGAVVLNESVQEQEFSTYTFGLLPGWWNASDADERLSDSPLASGETWSALLKDEGFVNVCSVIPNDSEISTLGAQQVFVATSDGETRHGIEHLAGHGKDAGTRQLPAALAGKLRPYELEAVEGISMPRPRHLQLFLDENDNLWLFLDHPPANTFTDELLEELCATLQQLSKKASMLLPRRLLYLSHYGEYFSLGGDRSELMLRLAAGEYDALTSFAGKARELLRLLASLDAVVVAVVNGTAQGGGLETLMATDLQLVREGVKLGLPEIKSGLIPGMGGLSYLQSQLGAARTKRLVMLGELISAREAHELGIISHVVEEPFAAALALSDQIAHLETARHMKKILARQTSEQLTADIDDWLDYLLQNEECIDTQRIAASGMLLKAKSAQNTLRSMPDR